MRVRAPRLRMPEVRCAADSEADLMDRQSPETLAPYQSGDFPHAAQAASAAAFAR